MTVQMDQFAKKKKKFIKVIQNYEQITDSLC